MPHILIAVASLVGLAVVVLVCLRYLEAGLHEHDGAVTQDEPEPVRVDPPSTPATRAASRVAEARHAEQMTAFSERRLESAGRQLVAEVEAYLAERVDG